MTEDSVGCVRNCAISDAERVRTFGLRFAPLAYERPEAFAEALVQLAGQPALCRQMGEAARKDAEARFSMERQVETVAASYRAVLEEVAA